MSEFRSKKNIQSLLEYNKKQLIKAEQSKDIEKINSCKKNIQIYEDKIKELE
jgi:flagellin-specific chaperone FliS